MRKIIWSSDSSFANLAFRSLSYTVDHKEIANPEDMDAKVKTFTNIVYNANRDLLEEVREKLNILLPNDIIKIIRVFLPEGMQKGIGMMNSKNLSSCMNSEYSDVEWFVDIDNGFKSIEGIEGGSILSEYRVIRGNINFKNFMYGKAGKNLSFEDLAYGCSDSLGSLVKSILANE